MMPRGTTDGNPIIQHLVEEELGFCCFYSFCRATKKYSIRRVAAALGVTPPTLKIWVDRVIRKEIMACPFCGGEQPHVVLRENPYVKGGYYFQRTPTAPLLRRR